MSRRSVFTLIKDPFSKRQAAMWVVVLLVVSAVCLVVAGGAAGETMVVSANLDANDDEEDAEVTDGGAVVVSGDDTGDVTTPTASPDADDPFFADGSGFGVLVAVGALLAAAQLARRQG